MQKSLLFKTVYPPTQLPQNVVSIHLLQVTYSLKSSWRAKHKILHFGALSSLTSLLTFAFFFCNSASYSLFIYLSLFLYYVLVICLISNFLFMLLLFLQGIKFLFLITIIPITIPPSIHIYYCRKFFQPCIIIFF